MTYFSTYLPGFDLDTHAQVPKFFISDVFCWLSLIQTPNNRKMLFEDVRRTGWIWSWREFNEWREDRRRENENICRLKSGRCKTISNMQGNGFTFSFTFFTCTVISLAFYYLHITAAILTAMLRKADYNACNAAPATHKIKPPPIYSG